jgi:hypothetical protein
LCLLLPMEQWELRVLLAQGCRFLCSFRVGSTSYGMGKCGALSSYVCRKVGLTAKGAPGDGAWHCTSTSEVENPECWAASHSSHSSHG